MWSPWLTAVPSTNKLAVLLIWLALSLPVGAGSDVANGPAHEGVEVAIDLPLVDHRRNEAGTNGAGLCVWASLDMAGKWANVAELRGLWAHMKAQPGGGWPERVDKVLAELAPNLPYVQYEGSDMAVLDAAIRTGRAACVTLGYADFYGGQTIAHMVLLAHLDKKWAAIIDNNDPTHWTWMSREEFRKRWIHPSGKGWAVVLIAPPPPPPPTN